jgi:hypothetical protein
MAMMISKFHKLIQSKVVWYIVLGVIVISFVGFFTPTMGDKAARTKDQSAGKLFGETVSREELRTQYNNIYLWQILSTGRMPEMNDETVRAMEESAWQRLAILRKSAAENILVSDQEVIQQIQRMPIFLNQSNVFDKNAYQTILGQLGVSANQLENLVREQAALQKLMYRPVQAALISPYELERAYHMYTDRMVLNYAVLPRTLVEKEVTVSTEEAQAFFAENTESFRMPARVRVSYVEYAVADFIDQAEVPEGAALQVYNNNLDRYRVETTGDVAAVEYKPFEEVEAEITGSIKEFSARRLAIEQATSLVADIAPKAQNAKPDFKGAAANAGLTVKTLPAFGPGDPLKGIDASAPFKQAALGLQDDIYSSFSDAVAGKDKVYVISLEQRYDSFLPSFEIVEKEATKAALARKVSQALSEKSEEIQSALTQALAAATSFEDAVKPFGLTVETTAEYDLTTQMDNKYSNVLVPSAIMVEQGGLCEPAPVEDGMLFAYVAQRTSTDAAVGLPAMRQELISGLSGVRSQRLAADWQAEVMAEADLQLNER